VLRPRPVGIYADPRSCPLLLGAITVKVDVSFGQDGVNKPMGLKYPVRNTGSVGRARSRRLIECMHQHSLLIKGAGRAALCRPGPRFSGPGFGPCRGEGRLGPEDQARDGQVSSGRFGARAFGGGIFAPLLPRIGVICWAQPRGPAQGRHAPPSNCQKGAYSTNHQGAPKR